jgi:hypothetical protein
MQELHLMNDILKELRLDSDKVGIKKTAEVSSIQWQRHLEWDKLDSHDFKY